MNKLITIILPCLLSTVITNAQILSPTKISTLKPINVTQTPVYTLTNARVSISTGRDNKEFPSEVTVWLIQKGKGILFQQPGTNTRNEMQVNSINEFGLYKWTNTVNIGSFLLTDIQQSGIILRIMYMPHLFTDAWRIEGISVTLEFKDQNGNLHPTLGNKTIVFNNTSGFLNQWEQFFECRADGNFTPIISTILKDTSGFN
ncbi:hypothetical protein WG954_14080 [Lacibacter sp. H375]|uniref:hypothetical protein n=1 Tax=Lacibacter sp. H375 TaxID=3133424 RepID=UPI0030C1E413